MSLAYDGLSAVATADSVRRGERSAVDVLDEHLRRIADHEHDIHAFKSNIL